MKLKLPHLGLILLIVIGVVLFLKWKQGDTKK